MKTAAIAVIEFNRNLLGIPERPISPMPNDEYEHLRKAILEEVEELHSAWSDQDVVRMVDALMDKMYFAIGGLYKMGLNADQIAACFAAVHSSNMMKRKGKVERRAVGNVPDAVKPVGFVPADIEIARILGFEF
jgi:predicted HAD superfamily Cof-like phosphohydrolase